jgi:hypothetical protein
MLRLIILAVIAAILVMVLARLFPRLSMQLRARLRGVLGSPFVRQILFGVVLRIIRLLLFRR